MAGGATPPTEDVAATTIETAPGEGNAEVTPAGLSVRPSAPTDVTTADSALPIIASPSNGLERWLPRRLAPVTATSAEP